MKRETGHVDPLARITNTRRPRLQKIQFNKVRDKLAPHMCH